LEKLEAIATDNRVQPAHVQPSSGWKPMRNDAEMLKQKKENNVIAANV